MCTEKDSRSQQPNQMLLYFWVCYAAVSILSKSACACKVEENERLNSQTSSWEVFAVPREKPIERDACHIIVTKENATRQDTRNGKFASIWAVNKGREKDQAKTEREQFHKMSTIRELYDMLGSSKGKGGSYNALPQRVVSRVQAPFRM